jgi:hypothetical protein
MSTLVYIYSIIFFDILTFDKSDLDIKTYRPSLTQSSAKKEALPR